MSSIHKTILRELKDRAALNGGACLSKEYINSSTPLLWRCEKGHTWDAAPAAIKKGGWCPGCAVNNRRTTIEELQEIAKERGGKCLSSEYTNNRSKIKWSCKEGHIWISAAGNIKSGNWCRICARERISADTRLSLKDIQKLAKSKGGLCLSKTYESVSAPLLWQCKEGHRWRGPASGLKYRGDWCRKCAGTQKGTIDEMRKLARSHGGECLSDKYVSSTSKLIWKCKEGHKWKAVPGPIKNGSWCGICADRENGLRKRETQFEKLKGVLKKKGYSSVSKEYINNHVAITVKCSKGHTWKVIPKTIMRGGGLCPGCNSRPGPKSK